MTPDEITSARPAETPFPKYVAPEPGDKYVFVSYKREDRRRVRRIVDALRSRGIAIWWDDGGIPPGRMWEMEIQRRLEAASAVVVVWSKRSVGEEGYIVREEARTALPERLVPVRIDRVEPPLTFRGIQTEDLFKLGTVATDPVFERLASRLGQKLRVPILPPPVEAAYLRFARKYWISIVVVAGIAATGWGARIITAGPTVSDLYAEISDRTVGANERAAAINALVALQPVGDPAKRTETHRRMIEFLAWRAKRPALIDCGAAPSTLKAAELLGEPDVSAAVAYLRSNATTVVPRAELSLDSVNLQRQNFTGADLRHTTFKSACLDGTVFTDARLIGSAFINAHLTGASFVRARLDSAQLGLSQLDTTSFFNACLQHANFAGANLSGADFRRATITWTNFGDARGEIQRGWAVVDVSARSNARFVGTQDVSPDDRVFLESVGASFTIDFDQWEERRRAAAADTGTGACRAKQ